LSAKVHRITVVCVISKPIVHLKVLTPMSESDVIHQFFMRAHTITQEAWFVVTSLPNAELDAVEMSIHRLEAIRTILANLDDPHCTPESRQHLTDYVNGLLVPLEQFLHTPQPIPSAFVRRERTGRPGRPRYIIDLERAMLLHDLGNAWREVADAMGVGRRTIYNHLAEAGLSSARKEWTTISDADLDTLVRPFCREHPFSGSAIVLGHLEGQNIHVPRPRVQQSLKRVDPYGVLSR
jgi:predicted DNA-binding protein (UPF0251 family)